MKNESIYSRTEMLLGEGGVSNLRRSHVAVFGIGGVGGYAVEALVRAGVGELTLVDADRVSESNLNRQIVATRSTVGSYKTEAARQRILDINPDCRVNIHTLFFGEETKEEIDFDAFDYIIDAIDSVRSKILLIRCATESGKKIISSMGAGNKLDPTRFHVTDISKTHTDPLAKVIRCELRRLGINRLPVVFSDEEPIFPSGERTPGSVSFVPSAVGLILAGEVIKSLARSE